MEQLNDSNFDQSTASGVVLVDFWAEWCGPCRAVAPVLEAMAKEYEGKVTICKVNIDENPEVPAKFGIRSIPTFVILNNGEEVDRAVGAGSATMTKIKNAISPFL